MGSNKQRHNNQVIVSQQTQFSGPIPHPDVLREYDKIIPGAAERIVAMAEREQEHRHAIETKANNASWSIAKWGQIIAFILVLLLLCAGVFFALQGFEVLSITIFSVTIISIASIFALRVVPSRPQP